MSTDGSSSIGRGIKIGATLAVLLPFLAVALILVLSTFLNEDTSATNSSVADTAVERVDFTLQTIDGETVSLESFAGKWVLVDFWATWCAPCRQEAPILASAYEAWQFRDVEFLGVAVEQDTDAVRRFVEQESVPYKVALYDGSLTVRFGVVALPEKFFISPEGNIHPVKLIGPTSEEQLESMLRELTGVSVANG